MVMKHRSLPIGYIFLAEFVTGHFEVNGRLVLPPGYRPTSVVNSNQFDKPSLVVHVL